MRLKSPTYVKPRESEEYVCILGYVLAESYGQNQTCFFRTKRMK